MGDGHGDREREIFEACVELPLDDRSDYVRQACGDDDELAERVRGLLSAHERVAGSTTSIVGRLNASLDDDPKSIGPYRVLERLGEGGMGVVFLADQTEPIRRRVAIKIIKLGMDTREVIARFDSERQALALMNHPHIARILDAGATEGGRPYFVMEYVPGISIVHYCDRERLGVTERLELFRQVCRAVQHAHLKGVIHRDLKPSNILVTEEDGQAVPKVIDFGVAKATSRRLGALTVHTGLGSMIGTPEYMSPEQAETTPLDIDTRSDVYSLGVVLYTLLAGVVPFELSGKGTREMQRVLAEQEPEPPSSRFGKLGEHAVAAANERGTSPAALRRRLTGELDWIALTALRKDRRRRYQTAQALADDIERYLNGEPVRASSPSAIYRLAKFVKRHRVVVGATSIAAALVVTLVAFYTFRLAQERDRANRAAARASQEARVAEQVTDFLVGLFSFADPSEARGSTITARQLLEEGASRITEQLSEQPEVQAELMSTIGRVYLSLGMYDEATPLLDEALEVHRRTHGQEHADVARSLNLLGELEYAKGDYESAERLLREALEMRRRVHGEDHPEVAESLNNVGAVLRFRGSRDEAEPLYREALEMRRRLLGGEHPDVTQSMNNLAVLLHESGDFDDAEAMYRDVLTTRTAVLGEDHPDTINSMNNLATLLRNRSDHEAAERLLREALPLRRRVLGERHPEVAETLYGLAMAVRAMGDLDEAETLVREALEIRLDFLGQDHRLVDQTWMALAAVLKERGDCAGALTSYQEVIDSRERSLPPDHWRIADVRARYGACLTDLGRYEEAERTLLEAHAALTDALGADSNRARDVVPHLVSLYEAWNRPDRLADWRSRLPADQ